MITLDWADIDAYEKPEFADQEELRIVGVLAKGFKPGEELPPSIAEVVHKLHSEVVECFGDRNVTGIQTPQKPHPENPKYRHVAYVHVEYKGQMIADLTFISAQTERHAGGNVGLTQGLSDLSIVLPLGGYTEASKKIVCAAWPYLHELWCGERSADERYILRMRGNNLLSSGHDAVLGKELGLDLPEKPIFLLESL